MSDDERVPYDESAWEAIVADLGDDLPDAPPPPPPQPAQPAYIDDEADRFIPPEPPPIPRPDVIGRFAWAGVLGGPLLLFIGILLPDVIGPEVVIMGILAFAAGFLTLALRHPHEPEDGWDDGSAV